MSVSNKETENNVTAASTRRWTPRRVFGIVLRYGIPLVVSVLLCKLLFDGVDWSEMVQIIREQCHFQWIALALIISIFSHIFRAMRWRIQLRAIGVKPSLFALTLSIFGTYAVNLVLPRLGEIWRSGYIARRQDASFSKVFGSMVADRLADTVTVLLLTIVTFVLAAGALTQYLSTTHGLEGIARLVSSPWLWGGIIAFVAIMWWLLARPTENKALSRLQEFVRGLWKGFAVIFTMPGKLRWLVLTFCIWGCYFMQLYVAFFAFDFTADIVAQHGTLAVLVAFVFSSLSMGVPSNGGIGPWQWSIVFALGIYGLGKGEATAFANLVMGAQTALLILLGIFTFVCIAASKKTSKATHTESAADAPLDKE